MGRPPTNPTVTYKPPGGEPVTVVLSYNRKNNTWQLNLRRFGRGRPSVKEHGEGVGVSDLKRAKELALKELEKLVHSEAPPVVNRNVSEPIRQIDEYLESRVGIKEMTESTAAHTRAPLVRIWTYFHTMKGYRRWRQCDTPDVAPLVTWLLAQPSGRKNKDGSPAKLSKSTVNHYCAYLKGFITYAQEQKWVSGSFIHRSKSVPSGGSGYVRDWLEPHEMGLLLRASRARMTGGEHGHRRCRHWFYILATEAYTGARETEVLGLMVKDLRLDKGGKHGAGTIHIRPHPHRRLKNAKSARLFSLWPAHAAMLREYLDEFKPSPNGLLFPKPWMPQLSGPQLAEAMWGNLRAQMANDLAAAATLAAKLDVPWAGKTITDHSLRHSYISCRSRMYERRTINGRETYVKVSDKDIIMEVGHASERMTREVYTHASEMEDPDITVVDYDYFLGRYLKGLGGTTSGSGLAGGEMEAAG